MLLAGDPVGAARVAGPMLEDNPSDLIAWRVGALAVLALGKRDQAIKNLKSAAVALAHEGNPIQSLESIKELEDLGVDTSGLCRKVADLYAEGSSRVREADMAPPPLPAGKAAEPWGSGVGDDEVISRIGDGMAMAWGAAMTLEDKRDVLPHVPLLSSLGAGDFVDLIGSLSREEAEAGQVVIEQGDEGDAMFIVASGSVVVTHSGSAGKVRELARLGPGAFFGEMALVSSSQRAARVEALERTVLLRADREEMEALAERAPRISEVLVAFCHARMLENLMRVSPVLAPIPARSRPGVIAKFHADYREAGDRIIEQGEDGRGLYLVVSGNARVVRDEGGEELQLAVLHPGDIFGEISLLMRKPSTASVVAAQNTALLFLPREEFESVTDKFPQLLKGAYDIAVARENLNVSIVGQAFEDAGELILV